jgi:tetratricopeptide (TPR) repeat protein/DNA-binding CsgD family transcriptional regulator
MDLRLNNIFSGILMVVLLMQCVQPANAAVEKQNKTGMESPERNQQELESILSGYNTSILEYEHRNLKKSIEYAYKALDLHAFMDTCHAMAVTYNYLACVLSRNQFNDEAVKHFFNEIRVWDHLKVDSASAIAYREIGQVFLNKGNYKKAREYFTQAKTIMEQNNLLLDLSSLYHKLSRAEYKMGNLNEGRSWLKASLNIYKDNLDLDYLDGLFLYYRELGKYYAEINVYDSALFVFDQALQIATSMDDPNALFYVHYLKGSANQQMGMKKEAVSDYLKSLEVYDDFEGELRAYYTSLMVYKQLVQLYYDHKDFYQAIDYGKRALRIIPEAGMFSDKKHLYGFIAKSFEKLGQTDSALVYMKDLNDLRDTILYKASDNAIFLHELHQHNSKNETENRKLREEIGVFQVQQRYRNIFLILSVTVAALLLVLITGLIYRYRFIRRTASERYDQEKRILDQEKEIIKQQSKRLEESLKLKEKQLAASALNLLKKGEFVRDLLKKMGELQKSIPEDQEKVHKKLHHIITTVKRDGEKGEWKEFEKRFVEVNAEFHVKLLRKHPDLTQNEKKICAFLKLNMSTSEISSITQQSENSINVARARLRKKLGLKPDESLSNYIAFI